MITDLNSFENTAIACDICIVGSGAAGLAAAVELDGSKFKVIIAESGDMNFCDKTQGLYDTEVLGHGFDGAHNGRFRTIGGSTTRWAGQVLPLMEHDFLERQWVDKSGWPIGYNDLLPYYDKAFDFLNVDKYNFSDDIVKKLKVNTPGFDEGHLMYHYSKWSATPNLRDAYLPLIKRSNNINLLKNANLVNIKLTDDHNSVSEIAITNLSKTKKCWISAKYFIFCVGGIETARLLLASRDQLNCGVGNKHDLVGRYLQDHPALKVGTLKANHNGQIQKQFNLRNFDRKWYSPKFALSFAAQKKHQILNACANISFDFKENSVSDSIFNVAKSLKRKEFTTIRYQDLWNIVKNSPKLVSPLYYYGLQKRLYEPGATFNIKVITEQEPNRESRVQLSDQLDSLGMPKSKINWKFTPLSWQTVISFSKIIQQEFKKANLGNIELFKEIDIQTSNWEDFLFDQNHHIGTTRMSDHPRDGVVNTDCRVHELSNLYIASSAVFPTGGHSNPTATIIALSYRIVDHIKQIDII